MRNTQEQHQQHNDDEQLSPHFSLREMTDSGTAQRHNIDNTPPHEAVERLRALCINVLEPLRRRFGVIRVTSGYRCQALNSLVGGSATSQHLLGEAADVHVSASETAEKMFAFVRDNTDFDQLLLEQRRKTATRWLHISYRSNGNNRHDARHLTV